MVAMARLAASSLSTRGRLFPLAVFFGVVCFFFFFFDDGAFGGCGAPALPSDGSALFVLFGAAAPADGSGIFVLFGGIRATMF